MSTHEEVLLITGGDHWLCRYLWSECWRRVTAAKAHAKDFRVLYCWALSTVLLSLEICFIWTKFKSIYNDCRVSHYWNKFDLKNISVLDTPNYFFSNLRELQAAQQWHMRMEGTCCSFLYCINGTVNSKINGTPKVFTSPFRSYNLS